MPNWTDDDGVDWFGKIECKRCLSVFNSNEEGEVPIHQCLGGKYYTSGYDGLVHHYPIEVSVQEILEYVRSRKKKKRKEKNSD